MNVEIYLNSFISSLVGYLLEQCLETSIFNLFFQLLTPPPPSFLLGKRNTLVPWPIGTNYIIFRNVEIFQKIFFQITKYCEGNNYYFKIFHLLK
jgi:hypothetical protein